jgi:hypothetical protein
MFAPHRIALIRQQIGDRGAQCRNCGHTTADQIVQLRRQVIVSGP